MGYFAWIYPLVAPGLERVMSPYRQRQNQQAYGRTLVIGAGTGLDVPILQKINVVPDLLEPDPNLADGLRGRFPSLIVMAAPAEHIPMPDHTYDTVISSLVLCSVDDLPRVLHEVARVLKNGGQFLFTEHVGHEHGPAQWLQHAIEPIWKPLAGGCHLTRTPSAILTDAPLNLDHLETIRYGVLFPMVHGRLLKAKANQA